MARPSWIDDHHHPDLDAHVAKLEHFTKSIADGVIDDAELAKQEANLVAAMEAIEAQLSDEQHAKVTRVFAELTAYSVMRTLHELAHARITQRAKRKGHGRRPDRTRRLRPRRELGRSSNAERRAAARGVRSRRARRRDRWGIPVRIKTSNPFTGDLDGMEIMIDYDLELEDGGVHLDPPVRPYGQWNDVGGRARDRPRAADRRVDRSGTRRSPSTSGKRVATACNCRTRPTSTTSTSG